MCGASAFGEGNSGTLTFGADAALLRDATTSVTPLRAQVRQPLPVSYVDATRWLSTAALSLQAGVDLRETVFLTAGLRGERNDGFTSASHFALLPSVGASVVQRAGDVTMKARVAYGAGMRPARTPMRETVWRGTNLGAVANDLLPEKQAGVEAGLDLYYRRNTSLQVTRFDQRASSLIQQVPYAYGESGDDQAGGREPWGRQPRYGYTLENLGAITNRGWEFAFRQSVGTLSAVASMSLVQSIVDQVAPGYTGELRRGDRMLAVPARTTGMTLTWAPARWQVQLGAAQVADWINYDRLALAQTWQRGGTPASSLTGTVLRTYWMQYPEVTRVRAAVARDLTRTLTVRFVGDNLLDRQRGEPDNLTIVPGRSLSFGVAARF